MTEWKARRFWKTVEVAEADTGFAVRLDGRPVRSPSKQPLVVPNRSMAEAIAAEWAAQGDIVDPRTMPVTRSANTAIEKVRPQFAEVAQLVADYGDADATCYRAPGPDALIARQAEAWDPLLDWAADTFGARLIPVQGVIPRPQPAAALQRLADAVHTMTAFELTGFHDLVSLSGSLVIGLAATRDFLPVGELWDRSRIDETWQQEQWGLDDEAAATAENKRQAFVEAWRFYHMARFSR